MPLRGGDLEDASATKPENDAEDELRRRAPWHYRPADLDDAPTIPCDRGGGTILAGRYHVLRKIGGGGMGDVYLAEDAQLDNKLFAIKMLPSVLASDADTSEHRHASRIRGKRRQPVPRDGLCRWRDPWRSACRQGQTLRRRNGSPSEACRRRFRLRAFSEGGPPRHKARKRADPQGRRSVRPGFRHRSRDTRNNDARDRQIVRRNAALHVAGTAERRVAETGAGRLFVRGDGVRVHERRPAVRARRH